MKHQYSSKERKEFKLKMATVFGKNLDTLSAELQDMLFDDLVTALESRLKVLSRVQSDVKLEIAGSDVYATVQT